MKKLNLKIKLEKEAMGEEKDSVKIVNRWIGTMIERATNNPKPDPRTGMLTATKNATMDQQRKYSKIMDILEAHTEGIVMMEDDDFDYLYRKFHQAEMPLQRDISKILTLISKALDQAKSSDEKKEEKK